MIFNIVVEGLSDSEAAKAVVRAAGHRTGRLVVKGGVTRLDPDIEKYNRAAVVEPWVVFRDTDTVCPITLRERFLSDIGGMNANFHLRLVHPMIEAWLLADRASFASFFGVVESRIPRDVEEIPHAKRTLLALAAQSRRRHIREGVVYRGSETGPLYVSVINEFAKEHWKVPVAQEVSPSLHRAVRRLSSVESGLAQ